MVKIEKKILAKPENICIRQATEENYITNLATLTEVQTLEKIQLLIEFFFHKIQKIGSKT